MNRKTEIPRTITGVERLVVDERGWCRKVGRLARPLFWTPAKHTRPFLGGACTYQVEDTCLVATPPVASLRGSHDGGRSMQIREINARKFHYNSARKISSSSCYPLFPYEPLSAPFRVAQSRAIPLFLPPPQDARSIRIIYRFRIVRRKWPGKQPENLHVAVSEARWLFSSVFFPGPSIRSVFAIFQQPPSKLRKIKHVLRSRSAEKEWKQTGDHPLQRMC